MSRGSALAAGCAVLIAVLSATLIESGVAYFRAADSVKEASVSLARAVAPSIQSGRFDQLDLAVAREIIGLEVARVRVVSEDGVTLIDISQPRSGRAEVSATAPVAISEGWFARRIATVEIAGYDRGFWLRVQDRAPLAIIIAAAVALVVGVQTFADAQRYVEKPTRALLLDMQEVVKPTAANQRRDCRELARLRTGCGDLIGELQKTRTALATVEDELATATYTASRFLAVISHELRTPLNGVIGMAQVIEQQAAEEATVDAAQTILSSSRALSGIFDDVLDSSNLDAGLLQLEPDTVDIRTVVLEIIEQNRVLATAKGLQVDYTVEIPADLRFIGDARRVRQVIDKLVNNAIKYTDRGSVRIKARPGATDGLRIEVADSGPGVPLSQRSVIFERFRQIDDSDTRAKGGAGLGLSISKELVELMGGQIGVRSAKNGGAVFWIDLPLAHVVQSMPPVLAQHSAEQRA